jgi:hypothetical protein
MESLKAPGDLCSLPAVPRCSADMVACYVTQNDLSALWGIGDTFSLSLSEAPATGPAQMNQAAPNKVSGSPVSMLN